MAILILRHSKLVITILILINCIKSNTGLTRAGCCLQRRAALSRPLSLELCSPYTAAAAALLTALWVRAICCRKQKSAYQKRWKTWGITTLKSNFWRPGLIFGSCKRMQNPNRSSTTGPLAIWLVYQGFFFFFRKKVIIDAENLHSPKHIKLILKEEQNSNFVSEKGYEHLSRILKQQPLCDVRALGHTLGERQVRFLQDTCTSRLEPRQLGRSLYSISYTPAPHPAGFCFS